MRPLTLSLSCLARRPTGEAPTKATEAKLDSSASPSATFSTPATSVAEAASSSAAMPPVPRSWTAIIRSTPRGPRRTRDEARGDGQENQRGGDDERLGHGRVSWPSVLRNAASSAASSAATG